MVNPKQFGPVLISFLTIFSLFSSLIQPSNVRADEEKMLPAPLAPQPGQPVVVTSIKNDELPALRGLTLPSILPGNKLQQQLQKEIPNILLPKALNGIPGGKHSQPVVPQAAIPANASSMPAPLQSFDGVSNLFGGWPPDTQGDIGANHYVQWINLDFAIWEIDKIHNTANLVYGPVPGNTLFQGFGGACETSNDGDPITLYDPLAHRWLMSQFALPNYPNGPFYQCIAVSQSEDPTGGWFRYQFQMPVNKMNDYTKFAVWPDAYYMTVNMFNAGSLTGGGQGVAALDRTAMLSGLPARMVFFDLYAVNPQFGGMLPADFDGINLPPEGAPGYFVEWDDGNWIPSQDAARLWEFQVNWTDPSSSTFGISGNPNQVVSTMDVDPNLCGYDRNCIPQPSTSTRVDAISDRLMYRLQYRNFGGYQTLLTNHTVDVDGTDHAGIHWFELRKSSGAWSMFQQGVFAPDADNRWMGSIAMDHVGDIGLGYSVSSSTTYPSVRYTGRLANDPLGALPQGEQSLVSGNGSQLSSSRWGDYSMMSLDPSDDCTFWYTQEYVQVSGSNTWKTRIGSFRYPGCSIGPQGTLAGAVTDHITSSGIGGALVQASQGVTRTLSTTTKTDGTYAIKLPVGIYDVTASAFGYQPATITGVSVISGTQTTQALALDPAPRFTIQGVVKDANTGWALYARVSVHSVPVDPVWTNPENGFFSISLPAGISYTLSAEAFEPGYLPASVVVGPLISDVHQNIELDVIQNTCNALGYQFVVSTAYVSDFNATNGGFTTSGLTSSWAWGIPTSGPNAAHSIPNSWATNLNDNYYNGENGYLNLPSIDLSAYSGKNPVIRWWQWLKTELGYDFGTLEASKDGGSTWTVVYGPASGDVDLSWAEHTVSLDPSFAVSNFRARFHFFADSSITFPGWYIDDLSVNAGGCQAKPGGLVVGNVYDKNTSSGLVGASVQDENGNIVASQATPLDPLVPDGLFALFSPQGSHEFTATIKGGYGPDSENPNVILNNTLRQDFYLPAGMLTANPQALNVALDLGISATVPLTVSNVGGLPASFNLIELDKGLVPLGPFEKPNFVVKPFKQNLTTSEGLGLPKPAPGAPLAGGSVLRSWSASVLSKAWGVAYDDLNDKVWVSSPTSAWGGQDALFEFSVAGSLGNRVIPHALPHSVGPADLAYNWNTGMLWVMNIYTGVANCIYEVDLNQGYTGKSICPGGGSGFSSSQRGLAYDPSTDTWFAGGWNDLSIHRFDSEGKILSDVYVGIAISGLAYNPDTQHLFVMVNESPTRVLVLDASNHYTTIGQFSISQGFNAYAGAGMEFDCTGNLWAVDQNTNTVSQFTSGESAQLCHRDVAWLNVTPISATLSALTHQVIQATLDASVPAVDQPGIYQAQLKFRQDTPYIVPNIPVTMIVNVPPAWGKLAGKVTNLGYCDTNPAPISDATVRIESSLGLTSTVKTDSQGYYQRWLDSAGSPYTVTVSAPEVAQGMANGLFVSSGVTTTQNFNLRWMMPCVKLDPHQISVSVKQGISTTVPLTMTNLGAAPTWYQWTQDPPGAAWLSSSPVTGTLAANTGSQVIGVTIDSSKPPADKPGNYFGALILRSADPTMKDIGIGVELTVVPLSYGVKLSGDQTLRDIPGETVRYTLTLTNASEGQTDSFALSLGPHIWPAHLSQGTVGPLVQNQTAEFQVNVEIPPGTLGGEHDSILVRAVSLGDPTKVATATLTTVADTPVSDLELSQNVSAGALIPGDPLTYTLVITNHGPTKTPRVTLVDVLPSDFYNETNDSGCSLSGYVLACELGKMLVGEVRIVHVQIRPMRNALLVNQAVVVGDAFDPDQANNWATTQILIKGFLNILPVIYR